MSTETILFDEYEFIVELLPTQISVILNHNDELYGNIIEEDDLYIKPISKFYSMIIKSLNKEDKYSINIIMKTDKIICKFTYSCDILEIEEPMILNKGLTYLQTKKLYNSNQIFKQNQKSLENTLESRNELISELYKINLSNKKSFDQKLLEKEQEFDKLTTNPLLPKSTRSLSEFIKNNLKYIHFGRVYLRYLQKIIFKNEYSNSILIKL